MYEYIGRVMPRRIKGAFQDTLIYAGVKADHLKFMGILFILSIILGLIFSATVTLIFFTADILIFLGLFLFFFSLVSGGTYTWLALMADSKANQSEKVFPEALRIMAANVKAGMTPDKALFASARPEFGSFGLELLRAGKHVIAGSEMKYALLEIPKRINSEIIENNLRLIIKGIESGGSLATLLEETARDIERTKLITDEVRANVLMYAIFIFFAAGIGAPVLYGISTFLVQVITHQMQTLSMGTQVETMGGSFGSIGGGLMSGDSIQLTPEFLIMFTMISLAVTSIFGGLIIGLVKNGEEKQGAKYIPPLIAVSIVLFWVIRTVMGKVFSSLM